MIDSHLRCRLCQFCVDDMYIENSSVDALNLLGIGEDLDTFWKCIPPSYREYQRFYHNNHCRRPRYLTWDINKMITSFLLFNSRISSGILGASLEFENFISLESANVIRVNEESAATNAIMVQMSHQVIRDTRTT